MGAKRNVSRWPGQGRQLSVRFRIARLEKRTSAEPLTGGSFHLQLALGQGMRGLTRRMNS
jgi:hypothetical protein